MSESVHASGPAVTHPSANSQAIEGQSQEAVHNDGIDYLKEKTFGSSGTSTSTSAAGLGSVPGSNPGVEDTTGGIASGHGGVSKTADIDSPVPHSTSTLSSDTTGAENTTLLGSIKSVLGFGATTDSTTTESSLPSTEQVGSSASHYGSVGTAGAAGVGASAAAGVASLTGSTYAADTAKSLDQTKQSYEGSTGVTTGTGLARSDVASGPYTTTEPFDSGNAEPTSTTAGPDNSATTTSTTSNPTISANTTTDPSTTKDESRRIPEDPSAETSRAERDAVESVKSSDKGTTDTTDEGQAGAGPGDVGETHKKPHAAGGHSGNIENPSAIPTAGGQRLGKAHWGESKIVPDNPKPQSAGIESENTGVVAENTAKNTGSATGGPGAVPASTSNSAHDEKLVDKIKDKLHIGGHH